MTPSDSEIIIFKFAIAERSFYTNELLVYVQRDRLSDATTLFLYFFFIVVAIPMMFFFVLLNHLFVRRAINNNVLTSFKDNNVITKHNMCKYG